MPDADNVTAGRVKGTRETAIAACKAAIDERLGPISSDQDTTRAEGLREI
jgi:hypothetical protein